LIKIYKIKIKVHGKNNSAKRGKRQAKHSAVGMVMGIIAGIIVWLSRPKKL